MKRELAIHAFQQLPRDIKADPRATIPRVPHKQLAQLIEIPVEATPVVSNLHAQAPVVIFGDVKTYPRCLSVIDCILKHIREYTFERSHIRLNDTVASLCDRQIGPMMPQGFNHVT